ncbi:MAG: ABC transporter substrate-binding protein [Actinobacteria bacterium]|nr:MAG: ABC transporter substrate-binding protein [Actinomycetota bacterium]RIK07602.1 MAG: hypothetical protein DCC48_03665 [Acidobacteriota bacterium]
MRTRWMALLVLAGLGVAACSNSPSTTTTTAAPDDGSDGATTATVDPNGDYSENVPVDAPGVTDTEIRVGGVVSATNPLAASYDDAFLGTKAYFQMINEDYGGVWGRQLELVAERDDATTNNAREVEALLTQDDVFAVLPVATLLFTGADRLAAEGVPTFGWNVQEEWNGPTNLFGTRGYVCFTCGNSFLPWLAEDIGATRVASIGYNVPQSSECAEGNAAGIELSDEVELVYDDTSLQYGTADFSAPVKAMKEEDVDLVLTCIDANAAISLIKEMQRQDFDASVYLPNSYDHTLLEEFPDQMEGQYVRTDFAPFELSEKPDGLQTYLDWMDELGYPTNELTVAGWVSADMFVEGLRGAGPEFSREKVIAHLNGIDSYTAQGILDGLDWTVEHTDEGDPICQIVLQVEDNEFVPLYQDDPGKPWLCENANPTTVEEPFHQ